MSPRTAADLWDRVRMAWDMLASARQGPVTPVERSTAPPEPNGDEPELRAEGFAEEALPWLDAVYSFALRLCRGDRDAADDLAQETFLRAHRFWHTFERGSNAKSWLFTICRNAHLHREGLARNKRERPAADLDARVEALSAASAFEKSVPDPEGQFFDSWIGDEVVEAIDGLPEEFREVLVLSDLGDLQYNEISEVVGVPVGTVKSRLFRARRLLQDQLREYAVRAGYIEEAR